ncbi:MAG: carbohydrate binding domain-containing protein [Thermoanaerobacteraceae bacterium]|nr:carbohydrate binding domain-containing protein [Thermoanaerobacteraceae bacterium]
MAYTKTVWSTGDTITASLANKWETQYDEVKTELGTAGGDIAVDGNNLINDTVKTAKLVNKPVIGIAAANLLDPSRMVFSRASEAYKKDGSKVGADVPRLEQGKFGQGVFVEEGTTNLVANPSFESDFTSWSDWGTPPTREIVTSPVLYGSKALHLITDANNQGVAQALSLTAGETYTVSCWVQVVTGQPVIMAEINNGGTVSYRTVVADPSWAGDGKWHRLELTFTAGDTSNKIFLGKSAGGAVGEYYFDGVQVEQKPYATSFVDGTRQIEQLYYDLSQELPDEWFAVGWFTPDFGSDRETEGGNVYPRILELYKDDQNYYRVLYIANSNNSDKGKIIFDKRVNNTYVSLAPSLVSSFSAEDTIVWAVAQLTQPYGDLAAGMHLWIGVNGGTLQYFSKTDTSTVSGITKAYIGCRGSGTGYEANGTLDFPLVVGRAPQSSEEIEALYRASDWGGVRNYPVPGVIPDDTKTTSGNTVWHAGNTGPGSGSNVDLLDGKHADDFASQEDLLRLAYDLYALWLEQYYLGEVSGGPDPSGAKALTFDGFINTSNVNTGSTTAIVDTTNNKVKPQDKYPGTKRLDTTNYNLSGYYDGNPNCGFFWDVTTTVSKVGRVACKYRSNPGGEAVLKKNNVEVGRVPVQDFGDGYYGGDFFALDISFTSGDLMEFYVTGSEAIALDDTQGLNPSYRTTGGSRNTGYGPLCYVEEAATYSTSQLVGRVKNLGFTAQGAKLWLSKSEQNGGDIVPYISFDGGNNWVAGTSLSTRTDPKFGSYTEEEFEFIGSGTDIVLKVEIRPGTGDNAYKYPGEIKRYGLYLY